MSARKKGAKKPAKEVEVAQKSSAWPEEFVPLRSAMLAAFCVAGWGLILGMLATGNNLLGLKQACMILAGARLEPMLMVESLHSMDIAAVLFLFVLVLGAGYIHVSLGLAALLVVRPWLDGFVYELDNFYFLWATMMLLGIWAIRHWSADRPVRGLFPLGVVLAYWLINLAGSFQAYQLDTTYRELLLWTYYGAVLFLAANATESRVTRNIVLAGFFLGMTGQALYAYPYLHCVLPWMRQEMAADPRRLAAWFQGVTEFTPEIARRFNMNRASASMVYPNALAALLILGLPACFTLAISGWMRLREDATDGPRITAFRYAVPVGIALFAVVALPIFLMGQLAINYALIGERPWFGGLAGLLVLSVGTAAVVAVAFMLGARRIGLLRAGQWLGAIGLSLLFPTMLGALWITYGRGAMLALFMAVCCAVVIYRFGHRAPDWLVRWNRGSVATAAACVVLALFIGLLTASVVTAPSAVAQDVATTTVSPPAVTGEGIDVSMADLANPASFRLRLSYWRVGLSMALDNWLLGVGLGNFKYAYPTYQYLGAGDVQNAHNGILQAWCESGLFGVLAVLVFWGYLFWAALTGILTAGDKGHRLLLLGITTGLLAFFLHALLDMNLTHPTLVTFAMVAAGLLIRSTDRPAAFAGQGRAIAIGLLAVATLSSGFALRPYLQNLGMNGGKFLNVDSPDMRNRRYNAAAFLVQDCAGWARNGKTEKIPDIPVEELVSLIGDRTKLFALGRLLVLDPASGKYMRIREDGPIPPGAVFQISRPWDAHTMGFELLTAWLAELERLDAHSPYDPELALLISRGYKLLVEQAGKLQVDEREGLRERMERWGEATIRRNPHRADLHQFMGWVHWTSGTFTKGQQSLDYFLAAIASFERCVALAPNVPSYHFALGEVQKALGQSYANAGQTEEAARYRERSETAMKTGKSIQEQRWALGLPE